MVMKIIPIAFAFDNNLVMPACVCLSSLMMNAKPDTFYDIFILHSEKENLRKDELNKLPKHYPNCRIQYRTVGDLFDNAFEIRGITTPAYYRLLIPELIPEYDKVIYADADIIFRMDLSDLYAADLGENYVAATKDLGLNIGDDGRKYIQSVEGLPLGRYLQSGFIVLNNSTIRQDDLVSRFKDLAKRKLKYQDQDILNLACGERVMYLPAKYNMTDYTFYYAMRETEKLTGYLTTEELPDAICNGNLHFNGHKPWKKYCVNFDIWWEYYRKSPYFDEKFYFEFFYSKLNELDKLSLWKRVKILVRYFLYGQK